MRPVFSQRSIFCLLIALANVSPMMRLASSAISESDRPIHSRMAFAVFSDRIYPIGVMDACGRLPDALCLILWVVLNLTLDCFRRFFIGDGWPSLDQLF